MIVWDLGPVNEWNLYLIVREHNLTITVTSISVHLWDSSCSCLLTQSLCLWVSHITVITSLINKNEWDICDRIYSMKAFIMEGLHNCNVTRSSLHRITFDDVSCFMEDTLQKIVEYLHMVLHHLVSDTYTNESSVCLHPHGSSWRHLCCSFRLDICVWVCVILVYARMYVYTWRSVIFLEGRENIDPSSGKNS